MIHDSKQSFAYYNLRSINVSPNNISSCEDVNIGNIIFNNNSFSITTSNFDLVTKYNPNGKRKRTIIDYSLSSISNIASLKVVLLLESPHIDEYINSNNGPAYGITGKRINDYLLDVLNNSLSSFKISNNSSIDLYLMNAIRYQCSLGQKNFNRDLRDSVFRVLWYENHFDEDFIERVNYIAPHYIINCVTKKLKKDVLKTLNGNSSLNAKINVLNCKHPLYWNSYTKIK